MVRRVFKLVKMENWLRPSKNNFVKIIIKVTSPCKTPTKHVLGIFIISSLQEESAFLTTTQLTGWHCETLNNAV